MKKGLIVMVFAIAIFATTTATAQNQNTFKKGDLAINVNYGFGTFSHNDLSDNIFQHSIGGTVEYGIMEGLIKGKGSIGVGGQVAFGFGTKDYSGIEVDATRLRIATRGVFHYQFIPQLDTYAGMSLGVVTIDKFKTDHGDTDDTDFIYPALFAGVRYMISDKFGFNSEISWEDYSFFSLGVTFKL